MQDAKAQSIIIKMNVSRSLRIGTRVARFDCVEAESDYQENYMLLLKCLEGRQKLQKDRKL